ncbi:porin [Aureimonas psammosilenae]|uniref:porin n=1 Tax=Aureimonas psammosilenae TaxID=2495496 RepID=UPI001260E03E|nr:porin [Aureimonas psammosilenae]
MNIKSLLLGSAAALVAVSGAKAADAPVTMVEPEPVEYVRVCDVYGTGFFYIPGTETCLKIGGYVRFRANVTGELNGDVNGRFSDVQDFDDADRNYDFNTQTRGRIDFDAREETELGTLRGFVRLQATNVSGSALGYGTSNNGVQLDQGFIQLGGLTIGRLDSLWAENDGLYTDNDWSVGDLSNNQIRYTFATNGFKISASVEDEGDGDAIPDVVASVGYEFAWGSVNVAGVYDEDNYDPNLVGIPSTFTGFFLDPYRDQEKDGGAFAVKANAEIKDLVYLGGSLKLEGHWASDPTEYASLAPGGYLVGIEAEGNASTNFSFASLPEEWQVGGGYQQSFGKFTGYLSGIYGKTFSINYANGVSESSEVWGVAGNLGYQVTSNFSVLGEVSYRNVDLKGGLEDLDQTRGFLEFKRSF